MEDNNKWVSLFNEKFEEFVKDLIITFPNDKDFKLYKNSFSLLKMVDTLKPIQMFREYAPKYRKEIVLCDESFFLNHDFKDELESDTNLSVDILLKLKVYWKGLESDNKSIIWSYLNLLYKLNDKICI